MATIESVWDLRPSSSPRSISVYQSPASGSSSSSGAVSSSSRGGSTNPFASSTSSDRLAHSASGSNPFDDAAASTSPTPRNRGSRADLGGGGGGAEQVSGGGVVSVLVGTERGALHRRTFGGLGDAATTTVKGGIMAGIGGGSGGGAGSASSKSGSLRPELPLGTDGSSSSGGGSSSIPSSHKPIDLANAAAGGDAGGGGAAIVSLVQTRPLSLQGFASPSHSLTSAAAANAPPVFLMLADDDRVGGASTGGGSGELGVGGAYAAQLVTINAKGNKFDQLGDVTSGHSGGGKNQPGLPPLSRASCAAYHPSSGYVYAAGTSVMSLPPKHALAVAHHLAGLDSADGSSGGGGGGDGFGGSSGSSKRGGLLSSVPSYRSGGSHQGHHHGSGGTTTTRRQEQQLALLRSALPRTVFDAKSILPFALGARSAPDAMCVTCEGRVAVVAVGNAFFAVSGRAVTEEYYLKGTAFAASDERNRHLNHHHPDAAAGSDMSHDLSTSRRTPPPTKILTFAASGRVHPAVVLEIPLRPAASSASSKQVGDNDAATSLLFMASGRECAAVEILHDPRFISSSFGISMTYSDDTGDIAPSHQGPVTAAPPRHGVATVPSPILSAVGIGGHSSNTPLIAILMSDGLVQTRSPSCLGVPLTTVEVGNRPNDFFTLRLLPDRKIISASYSGEGRVLSLRPESPQDLADRLMTLAVDAFGPKNFPRTELAEAISASYGASSYAGHSEPTVAARALLRQYLEAILSLDEGFGDESSGDRQKDSAGGPSTSTAPAVLLTGTALLCKLWSDMSRPNTSLANRAARACATKIGVGGKCSNEAAVKVCQAIAEDLLGMASAEPSSGMSFIEPASWLLRSCGLHERAIEIVENHMNDAESRNMAAGGASGAAGSAGYTSPQKAKKPGSGAWSQLRFESFLCSYLSDLWAIGNDGNDELAEIVLGSKTTLQLLERNPRLALTIFTSAHPQSEKQWEATIAKGDPLAHPSNPRRVIDLLKTLRPSLPLEASTVDARNKSKEEGAAPLPLTSGRALAVTYLESAVGISTGRQAPSGDAAKEKAFEALPSDKATDDRIADLHDELAFLLLEGVIAEQKDAEESSNFSEDEGKGGESELGGLYRSKLRRFLSWPAAKVRPERLLSTLPPILRRERALCLGRLGRHDDALRILYCDLRSLDMALEYCDARYEQLEAKKKRGEGGRTEKRPDCTEESDSDPYLPLVKVALASGDREEGVDAAVKVLSLRRDVMDCGTALRLLPRDLPMSRIARPFLIPAVVDGGAEVRQMKILAALLRARYIRLKKDLTEAQIESQSNLFSVPALKALGLGDLIRSAKPFRARSVHTTSSSFPDVEIIKHFFPRYLIIQAKITNSAISSISGEGRALADVSFVVAESSDEALTPTLTVPLKTLPTRSTGSVWCALAASPQRLDDVAVIACELRYTVLNVDATTGAPLSFGGGGAATVGLGQSFVEELQDVDIRPNDFEYR